jgi:hypothetical protein
MGAKRNEVERNGAERVVPVQRYVHHTDTEYDPVHERKRSSFEWYRNPFVESSLPVPMSFPSKRSMEPFDRYNRPYIGEEWGKKGANPLLDRRILFGRTTWATPWRRRVIRRSRIRLITGPHGLIEGNRWRWWWKLGGKHDKIRVIVNINGGRIRFAFGLLTRIHLVLYEWRIIPSPRIKDTQNRE